MIRYALLGIVQGLTEFLPVSSSGHLVLAERLFHLDPPGVLLEALLHLATLGAVLIAFRSDLVALARALTPRGTIEHRKEIGFILVGTVPIVILGLVLRARIDAIFSSLAVVGGSLLATGVLLVLADLMRRNARRTHVRFLDALVVGIGQAAALLPGLSRTGATITAGVTMGITPRRAARFSFLLAVPALFGAGLVSLWDALRSGAGADLSWAGLLIGTATAFFVGLLAIRALLTVVIRGRLAFFAVYCFVLGAVVLVRFGG